MKPLFLNKKQKKEDKSWQWPSSNQTKTLFFKSHDSTTGKLLPESCFKNSSEHAYFSDQYDDTDDELLEVTRKSLHSERLFFDFDNAKAILCEEKRVRNLYKKSIVIAIDTYDPCADFKKSMEEMVEGHGLKDRDCLEELLGCYLKVNGKINHGFIIGAFIDLLANIVSKSSSSSNDSITLLQNETI